MLLELSSSQSFSPDSVWQDEFNLQGSSGDSSRSARTWYWFEQGMLLTTLMSLMSLHSSREDTSSGNSSLLLFLATSGELGSGGQLFYLFLIRNLFYVGCSEACTAKHGSMRNIEDLHGFILDTTALMDPQPLYNEILES